MLERQGLCSIDRGGSHIVYYHPEIKCTVVIPRHREIEAGTLRQILTKANLTREELRRLLE